LARKGGDVSVLINNLPANGWSIQLFIDPNDPLIRVGWEGLNKCMIRESLVRTGFANLWSPITVNPWIFFDMDNREGPITITILGNKCFA
jgi:hypothetical protein